MRTAVLGFGACLLLAYPAIASPSPDNAELGRTSVTSMSDRWQGRHSYLYDDEQPYSVETIGAESANSEGCSSEPVRVRRRDGSTVVRRFRRCE